MTPNAALPPMGKYVLIHLADPPYRDDDQHGVCFRVARRALSSCDHDSPHYWRWEEFGPTVHRADDVDHWYPLP